MSTEKSGSGNALLKSSFAVAAATLVSRLLGLVRVRFEAIVLGGGELASGWFLAFAIPNLLRRILGEGALGNALMPIVAELDASEGRAGVKRELGTVFSVLAFLLALIVIFVSILSIAAEKIDFIQQIGFFQTERMRYVLELLPLLMPYGLFMCLVGISTSVLNYCREFFLPALGALLLNIFLISGLAASYFWHVKNVQQVVNILAYLVLASGLLQLLLMGVLLKRNGCFPLFGKIFSMISFKNPTVKKVFSIALPGMIGGIAVQVSFLVDRSLATWLGAQAVPALTYVDRLTDLPIGIFAVSLGSVLMSSMSRSAAQGNMEVFSDELEFSIRHVFFFCVPMAVGVMFFFNPLMSVLCLGGRYTVSDLMAARNVAFFYGAGIPVFCLLKVLGPAFYSRKKMWSPFYASLCAICLNIVLNIILMHPMQQAGIALATVIASVVNCSILLVILQREKLLSGKVKISVTLLRCVAVAMAAFAGVCRLFPASQQISYNWWKSFGNLVVTGVLFVFIYIALSAVFRAPELKECFALVLRRKK